MSLSPVHTCVQQRRATYGDVVALTNVNFSSHTLRRRTSTDATCRTRCVVLLRRPRESVYGDVCSVNRALVYCVALVADSIWCTAITAISVVIEKVACVTLLYYDREKLVRSFSLSRTFVNMNTQRAQTFYSGFRSGFGWLAKFNWILPRL